MWDGKNKAVTFSFDDGVWQDRKMIEILNKYHLKATFNLNSLTLGTKDKYVFNNIEISRDKINKEEVRELYEGHEVASHTLTHPFLPNLSDEEVLHQVEEDRKNLSEIVGYEVIGFAYPCGGENYNERIADLIRQKTGIKYARTIISTYNYELQSNLYEFKPTIYWREPKLLEIVEEFLKSTSERPQLLYIWGHTYETSLGLVDWELFEKICKLLSNRDDIYSGTNKEVFGLE